jgi:D-glycero-D-manno-heptose 1,7-bisphosphate phosphatase
MPSEKAIFLDRDGVIIRERGDYTWLLEDVTINDEVADGLLLLAEAGFIFIVISNQSGIEKGLYTKKDADYIHLHIERFLKSKGIIIEDFFYCPHHPSISNCICRKPDSLLLEKAIARHDIIASESYFIGDADRDFEAGKKAGVNAIKIDVNSSLKSVALKILSNKI